MTATASLAIVWTARSANAKTGPMPVSTTAKDSCPRDCPFMGNGCYAEGGNVGMLWARMSAAGPNSSFPHGRDGTGRTTDWRGLCKAVAALYPTQVWRHNQAGDLPHVNGAIDRAAIDMLVAANKGRRGFTYTHHNVLQSTHNREVIEWANLGGFTVNLSGNSLQHADRLADLAIAPVVVVLPSTVHGAQEIRTPKGRRVVVCPATYRDDVTCHSCKLCAHVARKTIVGFPAHGASKRKASGVAEG